MADTATRAPDSTGRRGSTSFGLLLLLSGAAWFLRASGLWRVPVEALLAGLLIVVGLVTLTSARAGRRSGWPVIAGLVLVIVLVATSAGPRLDWTRLAPTGNQSPPILQWSDLQSRYRVAAGNLTLDLSALPRPTAGDVHRVQVDVLAGSADITVPADLPFSVAEHSAFGEITMPDGTDFRGPASRRTSLFGQGQPQLEIVVNVRFGHATIETPKP